MNINIVEIDNRVDEYDYFIDILCEEFLKQKKVRGICFIV